MAVESKALNTCTYRVTGRFSCIPRHILTKKLRCKLQSVQIVTFHIIKGIYLRLGAKIMENFRLLPVVVIQLNMKEPHITFAGVRAEIWFDFCTCADVIQPCWHYQLFIHIVRKGIPRFTKSPSLVLIGPVLTEIQAFKNVKNLQRNVWKTGQIRIKKK